MKNYYEVLGVGVNADLKQIKSAYLSLLKKYHPDIYEGDKEFAQQKTVEINEAYNTLCDEQKKLDYDNLLKRTSNVQSNKTKQKTTKQKKQKDAEPWYKLVILELKRIFEQKKLARLQKKSGKSNNVKQNSILNNNAENTRQTQPDDTTKLDKQQLNTLIIVTASIIACLILLAIIL